MHSGLQGLFLSSLAIHRFMLVSKKSVDILNLLSTITNMQYNAAHLRRRNIRRVVEHLLYHQRASRAELSSCLKTAKPTISQIVSDLMQLQVVNELEIETSSSRTPGRPSTPVELDGEMGRLILVQIGVSHTRIALSPARLDVDAQWQSEFQTPDSIDALVKCIFDELKNLDDQHAWGIVVSVPGIVDDETGNILFCPNIRWLKTDAFAIKLRAQHDIPILLVQEIRALALGEHLASEMDNFLHVDFDTGVGGAAIIHSKLYDSPSPLALELGHNVVTENNRLCGCGNTGCLETLMGMPGLLKTFANQTDTPNPTWNMLLAYLNDAEQIPPWLDDTFQKTAHIIGGVMNVLGVNEIAITGLLKDFPQHCLDKLSSHIQSNCMGAKFGEIKIYFPPRRRLLGMAAVGIDRILIPHLTATDR